MSTAKKTTSQLTASLRHITEDRALLCVRRVQVSNLSWGTAILIERQLVS